MVEESRSGRVIGERYRLVAELGSGGYGRVWKARDTVLAVDVAIKELFPPPGMLTDEWRERLARAGREARNAARLRDHPNVVAVHDVVYEDGVPWIVMQLVDGRSLDQYLRLYGPLSADEGVRLAVGMLRALQAAERAGIVHRDVKPANVMMTAAGEILLTDFGIAVNLEDTALTVSGKVVGSPEYIAPERAKGQDATAASDLFSLGATLCEAVEGISPFRRETSAATLAAVLLEPPPELRRSGRLAPLIGALLEKDPELRPNIGEALALAVTDAPPPPAATSPAATSPAATAPAATAPPAPSRDRPPAADRERAGDTEERAGATEERVGATERVGDTERVVDAGAAADTELVTGRGVTTPEPVPPVDAPARSRAEHQMSHTAAEPSRVMAPPPPRWPRTGALILGGILVTLGVYGFLRGDTATAWKPVFDAIRTGNAALNSLVFVPAVLATVAGAFFVAALAASAFAASGPAARAVARVAGLLIGGCGAFFAMAAATTLLRETAALSPLAAIWIAVLAVGALAALGAAWTRP